MPRPPARTTGRPDTGLHLGVADHLGWAVVVAVTPGLTVADRRRIELVGTDLPVAPIHHEGGPHELHRTGEPLTDDELTALVARVRTSTATTIRQELHQLAIEIGEPIQSLSLRTWPTDFPADIARQRVAPFESQADPVMYRQELRAAAAERGWRVERYDAKTVEATALALIGSVDPAPLHAPRATLGPPWTKDHRTAFAAAIVAARTPAAPAAT